MWENSYTWESCLCTLHDTGLPEVTVIYAIKINVTVQSNAFIDAVRRRHTVYSSRSRFICCFSVEHRVHVKVIRHTSPQLKVTEKVNIERCFKLVCVLYCFPDDVERPDITYIQMKRSPTCALQCLGTSVDVRVMFVCRTRRRSILTAKLLYVTQTNFIVRTSASGQTADAGNTTWQWTQADVVFLGGRYRTR